MIKNIIEIVGTVITAWIGAIAMEMYTVYRWAEFVLKFFAIRLFISWVIWYIVEWIYPSDWVAEWSVIAISWVIAFQIMQLIIEKVPWTIQKGYEQFEDKIITKQTKITERVTITPTPWHTPETAPTSTDENQ